VTVWSVPPQGEKGSGAVEARPASLRWRADKPATAEGFSLKKTRRVELPNGLVLLLLEDHRLPVFVADAAVHDPHLYESDDKLGLAALTGSLLDEGTSKHTGQQIAESIEDVGGVLSLNSGGGAVRVLAPDWKRGLSLLLECLIEPAFPKADFAREKQRQLAEIEEDETQPDTRARRAFRAAVFGKHPNGRPSSGTLETVKRLTPADCAAFHKQVFVPNNTTVAIVGDFDSQQVIDEVKRLTANWKKAPLEHPSLPPVEKPEAFTQKILTMREAAQLHFFLGHVGVRRDNPDYYKLLVMDYILGTGPGFTDRLSSRLRDREGLAYTVRANITSTADREPGLFVGYIGTDNDNFARVKKEFLEELNRIREEPPSAQEVEDAKRYLQGSRLLDFTRSSSIASELLSIERHHLGFNYLEDFRKAVDAVTPEDVQAVARKYLDPKRMVLVAAGAIDENGKPLAKLPAPKR
jgi:zinc protease